MKNFLLFIAIIILLGSCKKKIEDIQQDLVIKAMTDGQWVITNFTQNSNNITSAFIPYKFKYYSNKTVDAIKNGTLEKTGNWDGNATNLTTWADFPSATYPLGIDQRNLAY
jgi:hypothetical protein